MADEIIEEVWRIKDEIAREHGYDVERLAAHLRRREQERVQREEDGAVAGEKAGTTGSEMACWVETEFGRRDAGGAHRPGT